MANEKPSQPSPAVDLSSPSTVLGRIIFSEITSKNQPMTYSNGQIQHNLVNASVELGKTGIFMRARVVGIQNPGTNQVEVQFKFLTTGATAYRQPVITYGDAEAENKTNAWRANAVKLFREYRKANPKTKGGVVVASASGEVVGMDEIGL